MTHKEAIAAGEKFYTGKVCAKHPELAGKRYTSDWRCVGCRAAYDKKWRENAQSRDRQEVAR